MSQLFTPTQAGPLRLANRIVIAPMCEYSADAGCATDWHMIHLGHLALSGAALLFVEATAVEPDGRITPGDLGLWSDETEAALGRVVTAMRRYSPIAGHPARPRRAQGVQPRPWDGGQLVPSAEGGWQGWAPRRCRTMNPSRRRRRWIPPAWPACAMRSWPAPGARCGWVSTPSSCTRRMAT